MSIGFGIINNLINKVPIELHIPGYKFCRPGTHLDKRLARGDNGKNPLDSACKEHDIFYSSEHDIKKRNIADKILAEKAWKRVKSKDSSLSEKAAAWAVTNIMKVKLKLGMGLKNESKKKNKTKKMIAFKVIANASKKGMNSKSKNAKSIIGMALKAARQIIKKKGGKRKIKIPKIISLPKAEGGALPLIPIFAGLGALGALTNGVAGIAKAINDTKSAKNQLDEMKRHNESIESISVGKGLYLRPYKTGGGLKLQTHNVKSSKKKNSIS